MPEARLRKPGIAIALVASLAVGGCGFHLRGAPLVPAAIQPLAVQCSTQIPPALCQSVRDQLDLGGVTLLPPAQADYQLQLGAFEQDRRATAITVQAAAAEYTLRHTVTLSVITADRIPLIADTRLTVAERYRYDETNVLAKQQEQEALQAQLNDRLAQQILFRLAPLTEARIQTIRDDYHRQSSDNNASSGTP